MLSGKVWCAVYQLRTVYNLSSGEILHYILFHAHFCRVYILYTNVKYSG